MFTEWEDEEEDDDDHDHDHDDDDDDEEEEEEEEEEEDDDDDDDDDGDDDDGATSPPHQLQFLTAFLFCFLNVCSATPPSQTRTACVIMIPQFFPP